MTLRTYFSLNVGKHEIKNHLGGISLGKKFRCDRECNPVLRRTLTSLLHYSETSEGGNTPEDLTWSSHARLIWYKFTKKEHTKRNSAVTLVVVTKVDVGRVSVKLC